MIGPGAQVDGVFNIDHPVRVDGKLSGRLSTSGPLIVGENGFVEAEEIEVGEAVIRGRVAGRIVASGRVYLASTSRFRGSVKTPHLVVEEGAQVEYSSPEGTGASNTTPPGSAERNDS